MCVCVCVCVRAFDCAISFAKESILALANAPVLAHFVCSDNREGLEGYLPASRLHQVDEDTMLRMQVIGVRVVVRMQVIGVIGCRHVRRCVLVASGRACAHAQWHVGTTYKVDRSGVHKNTGNKSFLMQVCFNDGVACARGYGCDRGRIVLFVSVHVGASVSLTV